ncbi:hypothetical protein B0I08_10733 [Glaciihabitans tibetensis]|uniref:Uncharacterized protein n=1 Tax=Glaciihabitans tibetensis TaxID=1266600 RepID=A0A2T0VAC4_9MICO|nr:hypothetical protein [Glaciihabitans tibetensis]PRY67140.1 hypothetical protein B0I08_10733 [Glaciihabitans tibetensis]
MTTQPITIAHILTHFFAAYLDGKTGVTRRRTDEAIHQLRACIDAEAERILEEDDLRLLAAERQFDEYEAVARVMQADDLVFLLSIFVEPQWQPNDRLQRAAQLQLTEKLLAFILTRRLVDRRELACPILDVQAGISRGRAELRSQRASAQGRGVG